MKTMLALVAALIFSTWALAQAQKSKPVDTPTPTKKQSSKTDAVEAGPNFSKVGPKEEKESTKHDLGRATYGELTVTNRIIAIATVVGGLAALVTGVSAYRGLRYYKEQASAATRDHLNSVHHSIFERLDKPEVRTARHYVYGMDTRVNSKGEPEDREPLDMVNLAFSKQNWLTLGSDDCQASDKDKASWNDNKKKAEIIARALDQLGYLVREGIVPLNVVARFYSYPTLRCWYQLSPYIAAVRTARNQRGHMWEWENLVKKIIKGARTDQGLWKGTLEHDNLKDYAEKIEKRTHRKEFPTDENWNPPDHSWEWNPPVHSAQKNDDGEGLGAIQKKSSSPA
jgi:hypothetical protein